MNFIQKLIHSFVTGLSLTLSFGVLTHDTHVDKLYTIAQTHRQTHGYVDGDYHILQPSLDEMRSGQHTHSNYNPLKSTLRNSFTYQSPSIGPRRDSHHKELLRTLEIGGRHAFDNVNLPIIV